MQAKEAASDLVQKTLIEAHRGLGEFRGSTENDFQAWLRKILLHNIGDLARRFRHSDKRDVGREVSLNQKDELSLVSQTVAGADQTPSSRARAEERDEQISKAIAQLPERYREVIQLRHHQDLSFAQISEQMECSSEAARKLWSRALEQLCTELEPFR